MGRHDQLHAHQERVTEGVAAPEAAPYPSRGLEFNLVKPPPKRHSPHRLPWWLRASQDELRAVREASAAVRLDMAQDPSDDDTVSLSDQLERLKNFGAAL